MSQHMQFPQDRYPSFNMADLSPASPDSLSMHGLGRPADTANQAFVQYASLPAHARGAIGDLHTFASAHGHTAFIQSQGQVSMLNSIDQFIHDRGEPWNPLRANAGPICDGAGRESDSLPLNQNFTNFSNFRHPPPPSDVDTIVSRSVAGVMSDSGYGSLTRQSVGNPSVYGGDVDQSPETQSLILHFQQGMPQGSMSSEEEPHRQQGRGQASASVNRNANGLTCPVCNVSVKTNSEMKKHEARHNKPHKCDVPGCPKASEGFSTNNDLDRHKRCVHKVRKSDETVYRCDLGSCKDKPKDWPRQDNFRQHLKRKHDWEGVDLNRFTHQSSNSTNLASLRTSEAVVLEAGTAVASNPNSSVTWVGLDNGRTAPPRFFNGDAKDPRFTHPGSMVQFPRHTPLMEEKDFASLTGAGGPQSQGQITPNGARPQLDMDPVFSGVSMPPPPQAASATSSKALSPADPPSCIAPIVLGGSVPNSDCLRPQDIYLRSREMMPLEVDGLPRVSQEDPQPKYQDVDASMSDEMSVDESANDTASEDGGDDSDAEDDDAINSPNDGQADFSGDCGIEDSTESEIYIKGSPTERQTGADTPKLTDFDDETKASALVRSWMDKGMLEKILMKVGYQKEGEAKTKDQKPPINSSIAADNGRVIKCEECPKTFQRRCELKKHRKRHEKPYACTFTKCDKKFGSKNDWKRHENSQHFQLEIWRCAERSAGRPDEECGKVCHRRESLKSHLEKEHSISETAVLDKKLADCRMGRNFESRFWCGFCQKTIEPTGKGGPAHSERFDHIDDHFSGRGMPKADITEWKHVDTDPVDPAGTLGKGRREGSSASARHRSTRKRPYSPDENATAALRAAKRSKSGAGNRDIYWTCCVCDNYWSMEMTVKCMDSCSHTYCDDCIPFENKSAKDGLMA